MMAQWRGAPALTAPFPSLPGADIPASDFSGCRGSTPPFSPLYGGLYGGSTQRCWRIADGGTSAYSISPEHALEWQGNRDHGTCSHDALSRRPPALRRGERRNDADQLASRAVSDLAAHVRRMDHGLGHLFDLECDERRIQNRRRSPEHPGGLFRASY